MRACLLLLGLFACKGGGETADTDTSASSVVLNELVASNVTGLTDELGGFPDWVELYNPGAERVDLSGWTLTDAPGMTVPWAFPAATSIAGQGYALVFCDNHPDQGPMHADFKLSRLGEELQLAMPDGSVVDDIAFPAQPVDDVGYGRVPDGSANWAPTDPPTPGAAN